MRHPNSKLGWQRFILFFVGFFSMKDPPTAPHSLVQKRTQRELASNPIGTKLILKLAAPSSKLHKSE